MSALASSEIDASQDAFYYILVVRFFGRVKWVEQLIPVAHNCALWQRKNMCRLSAFVRHKFKSVSVNINGKFGVEWHRDFNKDFTQIYCVVEWCVCDVARYMAGHWGNAHRTCCLQLTQYSVVLMRTMHGIQQTIRTLVSPLFLRVFFLSLLWWNRMFDLVVPLTLKRFMALIRRRTFSTWSRLVCQLHLVARCRW